MVVVSLAEEVIGTVEVNLAVVVTGEVVFTNFIEVVTGAVVFSNFVKVVTVMVVFGNFAAVVTWANVVNDNDKTL